MKIPFFPIRITFSWITESPVKQDVPKSEPTSPVLESEGNWVFYKKPKNIKGKLQRMPAHKQLEVYENCISQQDTSDCSNFYLKVTNDKSDEELLKEALVLINEVNEYLKKD